MCPRLRTLKFPDSRAGPIGDSHRQWRKAAETRASFSGPSQAGDSLKRAKNRENRRETSSQLTASTARTDFTPVRPQSPLPSKTLVNYRVIARSAFASVH
jgi:hypothetical protein